MRKESGRKEVREKIVKGFKGMKVNRK